MTIKELETQAAAGTQMPEGLTAAEQLAFLSLRINYVLFKLGKLDLEQAKWEKVRIIKEYEQNVLKLKSWNEAHERMKNLAPILPQLKDSGCKTCRKFFHVLSGYKGENEVDV